MITTKFGADIHGPQRMNCNNFGDPLTFYLVTRSKFENEKKWGVELERSEVSVVCSSSLFEASGLRIHHCTSILAHTQILDQTIGGLDVLWVVGEPVE